MSDSLTSLWTKLSEFVTTDMQWKCTAHDISHIERVVQYAMRISEEEWGGDQTVILIWARLHESLDDKFFDTIWLNERKQTIEKMLEDWWITPEQCVASMYIIENVWFRKSLSRDPDAQLPVEFMVVEDTDRLEAIGAMTIARSFAYGWRKGMEIYNPDVKPLTPEQRVQNPTAHTTIINHFYEKLLHLKDLMHTNTWKRLAQQRHEFMKQFLDQFYREVRGE